MANQNRRDFLKQLGVFASFYAGSQLLPTSSLLAQTGGSIVGAGKPTFEMLAVGDSIIWGQGLKEDNKFTFRTRRWLEEKVFANQVTVKLKVKAHSGATIDLLDNEIPDKKSRLTNRLLREFDGEINVSTPTIIDQITKAAEEYKNAHINPHNVRLIIMDGGANDLGGVNIVDPRTTSDKIAEDAKKYCYESMLRLLGHSARSFPRARIVVTGYYPLISGETNYGKAIASLLNILKLGTPAAWLIKHFNRFLDTAKIPTPAKYVRNLMAKNSDHWYQKSNYNLERAIVEFNQKDRAQTETLNNYSQRVLYAKLPFSSSDCFETKYSALWGIDNDSGTTVLKPNDQLFEHRVEACALAMNDLFENALKRELQRLICNRAGFFHPNVKGSVLYATAIQDALIPILNQLRPVL